MRFLQYFLVLLVLSGTVCPATAQYKLILQTKQNVDMLKLRNIKSGELQNIPSWNRTGGGFLIEVYDLENTYILSQGMSVVKLYRLDTQERTQWIGLQEQDSISIIQCFASYGDQTAATDDEPSVFENISRFLSTSYSDITFNENNTIARSSDGALQFKSDNDTFLAASEVFIEWETKSKIKKISLLDLTTFNVIWKTEQYDKNYFSGEDLLNEEISDSLQLFHNYRLKINLQEFLMAPEDYSFAFSLQPLVFLNPQPSYFLIPDSIVLDWRSHRNVAKIEITNTESGKTIWTAEDYNKQRITYQDIFRGLQHPFTDRTVYELTVWLNDENGRLENQKFSLSFEILLNDEEFQELKEFVGW